MGRLRIMGAEGDRQIEWRRDDPESLLRTEREVRRWLESPGRLAFRFERPQLNAGERLNAFDPEASEIILVPQMRGG
jgi:hypothetical protein